MAELCFQIWDEAEGLSALSVYRAAIERGDSEVLPAVTAMDDPFDSGRVTEVREVQASKDLAKLHGPVIIVSASGMASGGRVVHHLHRLLPDHRNTVVLVGFQAPGTRGRQLADGATAVKMLGGYVPVRAEVIDLAAFSVHADQRELLDWLDTADRTPVRRRPPSGSRARPHVPSHPSTGGASDTHRPAPTLRTTHRRPHPSTG